VQCACIAPFAQQVATPPRSFIAHASDDGAVQGHCALRLLPIVEPEIPNEPVAPNRRQPLSEQIGSRLIWQKPCWVWAPTRVRRGGCNLANGGQQ